MTLLIQILMIIVVLVLVTLIMYGIKLLVEYLLYSKNNSPWIIEGSINGRNAKQIKQDPKDSGAITLYRSDDESGGAVCSYSIWFVIDDPNHNKGEWKHIFHKGNQSGYPNRAPGVYLHPEENKLRIYMNTFTKVLEYIDIPNIPIKKWVHCVITLNGKYMDIYINGYLRKRKELDGVPKQNFGDVWLSMNGGFGGYISNFRYYRKALTYYEIENITQDGPSAEACIDSGQPPPYLDNNWWFDV
jgi:hypothetical protein